MTATCHPSMSYVGESASYKDVLGRFCTGVTVVTSLDGAGVPIGFTCQTFSSLSLQPALVQLSVQHTSTTWPRIREQGRFVVNILAADHADVAMRFARSGTDKFAGVPWQSSPSGLPIFNGVLAWIECSLTQEVAAGDHAIVIGAVDALAEDRDREPLLFFRGELLDPAMRRSS